MYFLATIRLSFDPAVNLYNGLMVGRIITRYTQRRKLWASRLESRAAIIIIISSTVVIYILYKRVVLLFSISLGQSQQQQCHATNSKKSHTHATPVGRESAKATMTIGSNRKSTPIP